MSRKLLEDGVVGVDGAQFQLVIINSEGDGYYYTTNVQLGPIQRPLKPEMLKMIEQKKFVDHDPDPASSDVDASSLVEHDIPVAGNADEEDVGASFWGTYYLNLNAFQHHRPPPRGSKKGS